MKQQGPENTEKLAQRRNNRSAPKLRASMGRSALTCSMLRMGTGMMGPLPRTTSNSMLRRQYVSRMHTRAPDMPRTQAPAAA